MPENDIQGEYYKLINNCSLVNFELLSCYTIEQLKSNAAIEFYAKKYAKKICDAEGDKKDRIICKMAVKLLLTQYSRANANIMDRYYLESCWPIKNCTRILCNDSLLASNTPSQSAPDDLTLYFLKTLYKNPANINTLIDSVSRSRL